MYILAWKAARLVCSALSTVLDMLRLLIVAWPSPVQLRIMNPEMTVPEAFFLNCSDFRRTLRAAVFRAIQRNILGEKN